MPKAEVLEHIDITRGLPMLNPQKNGSLSYVLQLTDSATGFKCALKIDPNKVNSFGELFELYVKSPDESLLSEEAGTTAEAARHLSTIQDCIYEIDDEGNLLDLYDGIVIKQGEEIVAFDDEPQYELVQSEGYPDFMLLDLVIDRSNVTAEGNPYGYNIRKWKKNRPRFERFVRDCLAEEYGREAVGEIIRLSTSEDKKKFLFAVGKRIWERDFELYSRFLGGKIWFKDPAETLENIIEGRGGTCTEKASAMKLISDAYGFDSEYLIGGPDAKGPCPEDKLREMLETLDFDFGKKYMMYWQHMALLYHLNGEELLLDVTNGNVPFLFLTGRKVEELLRGYDKKSITVKMVLRDEEFYYHRVSQDIPNNLLFAMQDWIENVDLIHVFDDGLGLLIREDFYVWPVRYRDEDERWEEYNWWMEVKERQNFPGIELHEDFSAPGSIVGEFIEKYPQKYIDILEAHDYLVERYNSSYRDPGDDRRYNMAYMFVKMK